MDRFPRLLVALPVLAAAAALAAPSDPATPLEVAFGNHGPTALRVDGTPGGDGRAGKFGPGPHNTIPLPPQPGAPLRMGSVLLVVDEPGVLAPHLTDLARARGYVVRTARTAAEAVALAAADPPDVVLLALDPPAPDVGRELRRVAPGVACECLTRPVGRDQLDRALAAARFAAVRGFVRERLAAGTRDLWDEVREQVDGVVLPMVLAHTGGNQLQAAQLLGVARQTLRTRLRELGLAPSPATPNEAE